MSYLEEILPEFRKGAKIRRTIWSKGVYIYLDGDGIYNRNNELISKFIELDVLLKDDWELYQEHIDWDYIIKNKCLCWF